MNNKNLIIDHIFVYGSLMHSFFNYKKYLDGKVIGSHRARTKGSLYHMPDKGYPALIKGDGYVYGELLKIMNFKEKLIELDEMEGYFGKGELKNEYNREVKEIEILEDKNNSILGEKVIPAYVYEYNIENDDKFYDRSIRIPNGSWGEFMKRLNSLNR